MVQYHVVLIPAEEGGHTVVVPALPGCVSEGDTEEDALENVKDAIAGWLTVARKRGLYIPAPDQVKLSEVGVPGKETGFFLKNPVSHLSNPSPVSVPWHNKDLKRGTMAEIIRQAGLTREEFLDLL